MNIEKIKEHLITYHYPIKKRYGRERDGGYVIAQLDTTYD